MPEKLGGILLTGNLRGKEMGRPSMGSVKAADICISTLYAWHGSKTMPMSQVEKI